MSTNRSRLKTSNMAPPSGLFRSQQRTDDNLGASNNTPSKGTQFGQPTNQIHPPRVYSYLPSQPPFPGAPQFSHDAPFNMTPSSQSSTGVTQGYPSYGPSWQPYDFPHWGYGGPRMFAPQQFTGHGPSSGGAPWGPPAPPRNNPVIRLSSSSSTAPGQLPGAPRRPPISLATNRFQPAVEPWRTDDARISNLPPLPTISYDEYDEQYGSNNSSNLGWRQSPNQLEANRILLEAIWQQDAAAHLECLQ